MCAQVYRYIFVYLYEYIYICIHILCIRTLHISTYSGDDNDTENNNG